MGNIPVCYILTSGIGGDVILKKVYARRTKTGHCFLTTFFKITVALEWRQSRNIDTMYMHIRRKTSS